MSNKKIVFAVMMASLTGIGSIQAQSSGQPASPPASVEKTVDKLSKNFGSGAQKIEVSRERREQAYIKLLEGQRYIWNISRQRSQAEVDNNSRLAKQSFQKAVELDPTLAEAYTALSELTLTTPPGDIEEAIRLANTAVKIDSRNFGGHRLLARLYTLKSRLNSGQLNSEFTQKAIAEWKEIAKLDPRNAEAFAFLSEFYAATNKRQEKLEALRNWIASSTPLETRFYRTVLGTQADLSPESASTKLGEALIEAGETKEAVEVLSRAIADDPENPQNIQLLKQAVEAADNNSIESAVQALQQAVFVNPDNTSLIILLAQVESRTGKIEDAAKILREATSKISVRDNAAAAGLQVALGDLYAGVERFDEAIAVYQNALVVRGIGKNEIVLDDERNFAISVFDKMISTYKKANRPNDAKAVIERARLLLGNKDLFADRQLISLYRETGRKQEALQVARAMRSRDANDYGLLRLEASILTDNGKVDEAVALVRNLMNKQNSSAVSSFSGNAGAGKRSNNEAVSLQPPVYDDFINHLYISNLYSQAKRGTEAVESANQAIKIAQNIERKQIARLTLATAQQTSGDYKAAEATLRELLSQTPRNPIALNNLGYFLLERNEKLAEALELIKQAVEIDSTNPSYLDSLGWAYFKLEKYEEAEKHLKLALKNDASSATVYEHLGDIYQKRGKNALAADSWQSALKLASAKETIDRLKAKLKTAAVK